MFFVSCGNRTGIVFMFFSLFVVFSDFTRGGIVTHNLSSLSLVGSVQGLLSCFSLSLWFSPTSHVEGSSLTTSLRYQDLRSFFCNQLAYGTLVIRRAVEMATLGS